MTPGPTDGQDTTSGADPAQDLSPERSPERTTDRPDDAATVTDATTGTTAVSVPGAVGVDPRVSALPLAERVALLSGADFWNSTPSRAADVPSMVLTDGPHGVRHQPVGGGDHLGIGSSAPATCFPTASLLGSTWDPELVERVGAALGREARALGVGVLLGPGLNVKRHPGAGRNFEYLSEDPLVSGSLAAAMIRGVQSEGVAACPKHFVANNRETYRMVSDSVVDERTLREIYLRGFEIAVREGRPWALMTSYNKVNGRYVTADRRLLTDVLRDDWGFDGMVVTDWGGIADKVAAVRAGVDLEMPSSGGAFDRSVVTAVEDGDLDAADVDRRASAVARLARRVTGRTDPAWTDSRTPPGIDGALDGALDQALDGALDRGADHTARPADHTDASAADVGAVDDDETVEVDEVGHHRLARRVAAAGTVLLTNDGTLPLEPSLDVAIIGAFADHPRYQGAGSSQVVPTRLDTARRALEERLTGTVRHAAGYDPATGEAGLGSIREAAELAGRSDVAVVFVGLPAIDEAEGFDRTTLALPPDHDALVAAVCAANPRTVVVLVNGAPVLLPWADRPAAVVEAYLGGQAAGSAICDVLVGDAEPGGRLAETFPASTIFPSAENFDDTTRQVEYREGMYVGYRFHTSADVRPRFAFGHGLSYTTFDWTDLRLERGDGDAHDVTVHVDLTNTGDRAGSEVVQVYLHRTSTTVDRPTLELRGFAKVHLEPGESTTAAVRLDRRSFAHFDVPSAEWVVEGGTVDVVAGASSVDERLRATLEVAGDDVEIARTPAPNRPRRVADDTRFTAMLGRPIPTPPAVLPFSMDTVVDELGSTRLGRIARSGFLKLAERQSAKMLGDDPDPVTVKLTERMIREAPLRFLVSMGGGPGAAKGFDGLTTLLSALRLTGRGGGDPAGDPAGDPVDDAADDPADRPTDHAADGRSDRHHGSTRPPTERDEETP